ncbi:MAG: NPCBM/NEW2 domain-containing protein [Armatimonadetes bacterium]|nr:NPCBM/NEW2 domain-containing protein [Armatimonadota bacterium]
MLLALSRPETVQTEPGVPLSTLDFVVNHGCQWFEGKRSIASHIVKGGLGRISNNVEWEDRTGPIFAIFDLEGKYSRFKVVFGLPDDIDQSLKGKYTVSVDGDVIAHGDTDSTAAYQPLDLDVSGGRTLRIEFQLCFVADPILYKSKPMISGDGPRLIEPENRTTISGDSVKLKWASVEGATAYGVELINTQLDSEAQADDRILGYTVRNGKTELEIETDKLAAGTYRWCVIAFGPTSALSGFSKERAFTVKK